MLHRYLRMLASMFLFCLFAGSFFSGSALAQEPPLPADDDALKALVEQAGSAEDNDGADLVTVFKRTVVQVEESGLSHIDNYELIKCLSVAGAAQLARLRFDWDPASNTVQVRKLRILRQDGTIEVLPVDSALDLPQPQWAIYWGARMILVPLPRLEPGDAVEVETSMKGFLIAYLGDLLQGGTAEQDESRYIPPMEGHFYDVVYFQDHRPVKLRHYTAILPKDKPLQFEVYNGEVGSYVSYDGENVSYSFWKENLPAYHEEQRAVEFPDVMTKVVMATVADWPEKSRWFYEANQAQFQATPAIQAKVDELVKGLKTDEEKISALTHWSANEIRYSGISMGKGEGYTLHTGEMIFNDRSGVCKDKAGMAITMLKAAGYEVYPAMTMAGARVERIPADQFNHCVVALKDSQGELRMLDPTWVVYSPEVWSSAEGEQHFVVGTPEGDVLRIMPAFPPEDNKLRVQATSEILADGTLVGKVVFSGAGYAEQRLRRELVHYNLKADWQASFEDAISRLGPGAVVEPVKVDYAQIQDVNTPIRYEVHYRIPAYAQLVGDQMLVVPPMAHHLLDSSRLAPYLTAADLEERTQGVLLWAPRMRDVSETLTLPKGYKVAALPADRTLDGPAASLSTHLEEKRGKLEYTYQLIIKDREIPVEDYANFREVVQAAKALPDDAILLERK